MDVSFGGLFKEYAIPAFTGFLYYYGLCWLLLRLSPDRSPPEVRREQKGGTRIQTLFLYRRDPLPPPLVWDPCLEMANLVNHSRIFHVV